MVDGPGTETRTYDNLDRLLTVTRGSLSFSYEYDAAGNVTKRTYPDGVVVDYTYDPLGRMASVVNGTRTVTYDYDAASNLVTTTLPSQNGYVETRSYDRAGRLLSVNNFEAPSTTLSDITYTRDPVGNPLTETTTGTAPVTKAFAYDNMDRLTSVCFQSGSCPGGSDPFIRWTYDGVGNRLTEARPAGTTSSTYDALDRLLSAGSTSYTYDENGNQLSAGSRTFTWDLANRLKTTTLSPTTTTYTYDGDGNRAQASTGTTNQSKTNFIWDVNGDLPQVVRESSGANSIYRRYFYGLDLLWMSTIENNNNAFYFHNDPLGSVRHVTAQGGATQWSYDYEPFGATRTQTGSTPTNLMKFTGEYEDPTGLYHLRARQYDPSVGRFLTTDPSARQRNVPHFSSYVYVDDRPMVAVDPSGKTLESSDVYYRRTETATERVSFTRRLSASPPVKGCSTLVAGDQSDKAFLIARRRRGAGGAGIKNGVQVYGYHFNFQAKAPYRRNASRGPLSQSFLRIFGYNHDGSRYHQIGFTQTKDKGFFHATPWSLHTNVWARVRSQVDFVGLLDFVPPVVEVVGPRTIDVFYGVEAHGKCIAD